MMSSGTRARGRRACARLFTVLLGVAFLLEAFTGVPARAEAGVDAALQARLRAATFEVVMHKPEHDPLTYEKPLPLEQLPYAERTDPYFSVGTAFAIAPNTYVSAAHVFMAGVATQLGAPALRDAGGEVHEVDQVLKFSDEEDFIVFTLKKPFAGAALPTHRESTLDAPVYAVGNALGEGVIVRAGVLTSYTPEEVDGRWKWLRFSAAASPGNSGGPLVDAEGRVLGIVLRKSENENLNYAAPIALALDAPEGVGRLHSQMEYFLPVMDEKEVVRPDVALTLPQSLPAFTTALRGAIDRQLDDLQARLLQHHASTTFPNGPGSRRVLFDSNATDPLAVLVRGSDGNWASDGGTATNEATLAHNGKVTLGTIPGGLGAILRRPDDVPAARFYADSQAYMDAILRALEIRRPVGNDNVRVTSLGPAREESRFVDHYGRVWQVRHWDVPFMDVQVVSFALPTPDGYEAILRIGQTATTHEAVIDLRAQSDFMDVSLHGTLAQWRDYLAQAVLLPKVFANIQLASDDGKRFHYRSPRVTFGFDNGLLNLAPDSALDLHFGYIDDGGHVTWDVVSLTLQEHEDNGRAVLLRRNARPDAGLPKPYHTQWSRLVRHAPPFDASVVDEEGNGTIEGIAQSPVDKAAGNAQPQVLYEVKYVADGHPKAADMKAQLQRLLRAVRVTER